MKLQWIDENRYSVDGVEYTTESILTIDTLTALFGRLYVLIKSDTNGTFDAFKRGGETSTTTKTDTTLLKYVIENNDLTIGKELTETEPSVPNKANNKGFLTGNTGTLFSFYEAFAYNEVSYDLFTKSDNVEVSFLCSDRRYGVAGSRRAWSPYFKLSDLEKPTFTLIQNALVGTDTTANYNIRGKITRDTNGTLLISLTDTHSGNNLYGSIINIRHRIV